MTHEQRQRRDELERMPAGRRTAAQERELEHLHRIDVDTNIYFIGRDGTMPDGDDDDRGKKVGDSDQ